CSELVEADQPRERLNVAQPPVQVDRMAHRVGSSAMKRDLVADERAGRPYRATVADAFQDALCDEARFRRYEQIGILARAQLGILVAAVGKRASLEKDGRDSARSEGVDDVRELGAMRKLEQRLDAPALATRRPNRFGPCVSIVAALELGVQQREQPM